ncbi:MAG: DUF5103 domain-containing protein [Bacteroidales bacterium]
MKKTLYFFLFLILYVGKAYSQQDGDNPDSSGGDYFRNNYLRYQDHIYVDHIKTPLLYREGWEMSAPMINLEGEDKLILAFDDLSGGQKQYQYTLIHCDADWFPSRILQHQYLDGYYEDYVTDYRFSFNTLQSYTHYETSFPNENIRLKLSGNYLLVVYPEGQKESPVLTLRFWVVEPLAKVRGMVKKSPNTEEREEKQQVVFSVFSPVLNIVNPYQNVKAIIRQNGRWDNCISNLKPLLVKGSELDYSHIDGNIFDGGNEFRHADLKSIRYSSDRVRKIEPGNPVYKVYLMNDERRPFKVYVTDDDINGQFLIKTEDGTDPSTDADYVEVYFSLPYAPLAADGNIYLVGGLTHWQLSKENRMTYNFNKKAYELKLLLKQGYYNYKYLFLENGTTIAQDSRVEGNHFETRNEYTIYVYYQAPGNDHQQLIAVEKLQSGESK